jgi:alkylation response protein AidB-like acyl-CoA dehydrogenase
MDLLPSPEQTEIIESSAAFLRGRLPIERTRSLLQETSSVDAAAWAAAAELGWFGLGLPEALGGVGCGLADEALLFREIGRSLASGPFVSSVLGARVAAFGGRADLAEEIVGGRAVGLVIPAQVDVLAASALHGEIQFIDPDLASGLLLVATESAAALIDISQLHSVRPMKCYDDAVRLYRASADQVTPLVLVSTDVDPVERRGHVLAAAMLTGITEATRDISSEHAKVRVQFDRPIGVNQAIKHPCANMAVQAQLALAQTLFAAVAVDESREDAEFHALSAHLVAARAAQFAADGTVQVLGGMGFTFEHNANLYAKRAYVLSLVFGGADQQLARLLALPEAI